MIQDGEILITKRFGHRSDFRQLWGLVDLMKDLPRNADGIEIGCYDGVSTVILSCTCNFLYTVDPLGNTPDWVDRVDDEEVYQSLMIRLEHLTNVQHIRFTSDDAYGIFVDMNKQFDFVYIDGYHSYDQCYRDIVNYWNLIKVGGFICGHDYANPYTIGVTRAVNDLLGTPDKLYLDWSWLHKKNREIL